MPTVPISDDDLFYHLLKWHFPTLTSYPVNLPDDWKRPYVPEMTNAELHDFYHTKNLGVHTKYAHYHPCRETND